MDVAPDIGIGRPPARDADPTHSTLEITALLLLCVIVWALSHAYRGLFHDAGLYTLQALARLTPTSLGQDLFLRFGSQDRYTIFSPLFAAASRLLGAEAAAATLTFMLQMALVGCGWLLARAVMPARLALYGLAVLVAVPGNYGTERIFTCVEPFLTPRMAAEALVLASLAAAFTARTRLALALIVLATLMHPIIAAAGIAALLCLYLAIPHPRLALRLLAVAAAVSVAMLATPLGAWGRFDPAWLRLVMDRSPYLFLSTWQIDDWGRAAVTLATLSVGLMSVTGERARTLCQAALLTTVGGLVLTFIACDELHLVLLTQLQPWRWQWLGTVAAALFLPLIVSTGWRQGVSGRTTLLLLAAAWIFGSNAYALAVALATVGAGALMRRLAPNEARWVFWGACGMLALALTWRVASNLEFTDAHYLDTEIPLWLRRAMSVAHDGSAPIAVVALVWWLANSMHRRVGLKLLAVLAAAACIALAPQTWARWTVRQFPPQRVAQFAPLRERIPVGADVFWPESPLAAWLLLERPNYLSVLQTSGMVFSRDTAMEVQRRALTLAAIVPPATFLDWSAGGSNLALSLLQLQGACRLGAFEFLVTRVDLGAAPVGILPQTSSSSGSLRLYRCPIRPS
jgi:hypothetical protein